MDMRQRKSASIDGFVTRRPQRTALGETGSHTVKKETDIGHMRKRSEKNISLHTGDSKDMHQVYSGRSDDIKQNISQSLQAIDVDASKDKATKKKRHKKRRWVKIVIWVLVALIVFAIGFLLFKALSMSGRVFNGNILDVFQQQELKMDEYGRSNVLIVGTTDDDPVRKAEGDGILTDSIMVVSVNQKTKDAYMFSIPRDLYVKYNEACVSGYEGKINVYFGCIDSADTEEAETNRLNGIREFVGDILDMDIQYTVHVKSNVIRDAVNAVGGVTVNVDSRDPRGVLDASIDWMCTQNNPTAEERQKRCPTGHYIDFPNGPNEMDGDKAMWFSRARGVGYGDTYGLEESNFDREKNQQLVLMALKEKAVSTGTLTDFGKVTALMDAMGDNLRTNIETKELQTIMKLASEIQVSDIHQLSFVDEDNTLVTTGNVGGQSIVQPVAGLYNYSQIRAYLQKNLNATPVTKENAKVIVLNGGGAAGGAQIQADKLEALGMNIVQVGNAEQDITDAYRIYQLAKSGEKTATSAKLAELYGVKITTDAPPFSLAAEADFVVVVGPEASASTE